MNRSFASIVIAIALIVTVTSFMANIKFGFMVLSHFIFDLLILIWKKENKLLHYSFYTMGFIPVFYIFKINYLWLLLIFFSHFVIDEKISKEKLFDKFKKNMPQPEKYFPQKLREKLNSIGIDSRYFVVTILADQLLHLSVLFLISRYDC